MSLRRGHRTGARLRRGWLAAAVVAALVGLAVPVVARAAATSFGTRTADADTTSQYTLGDEGSTRYDGRVWVDKSVSSDDSVTYGEATITNDSDFLVTYSALATSTVTESVQPTDTVFILDLSASMTWGYKESGKSVPQDDSRLQAMVNSVNKAIGELVAANPQNRIAIVTFNGTCTDDQTLIPNLMTGQEIEDAVNGGQYLTIKDYDQNTEKGKDKATATVHCNVTGANASTSGGTNIQAGLFRGMSILADSAVTTATVDGETVTRRPNVILMSDGAPTTFSSADDASYIYHRYDGGQQYPDGEKITGVITTKSEVTRDGSTAVESGSWWDTNSGVQIGAGNNDDPDSADGLMTLLTASYLKNAIAAKYYGNATGDVSVYTVGFGTDVQDDDMVAMANLVLNPGENLGKETGVDRVDEVSEAWDEYARGQAPTVHAPIGDGDNTLQIPFKVAVCTDQNKPTSLDYVTRYFSAEDDAQLDQALTDITGLITSSAMVPTEVTGDPLSSGYLTYVDTTGEYMEVKGFDALIFDGKRLRVTKDEGRSSGDKDVYVVEAYEYDNPAYPGKTESTSNISIEVAKNEDDTQTVTVKIPAALIPLLVNTVTLNGNGSPTNNESAGNMPLRLCYEVGLSGNVEPQTLDGVSDEYLAANTENGKVSFYSNKYDAGSDKNEGVGAYVTFEPADTNPFYFAQEDLPLYKDAKGEVRAEGELDAGETYYVPVTYYTGKGEGVRRTTDYVARTGATLEGYTKSTADGLVLKAGSPRIGNLQDVTAPKTESGGGATGTYANYREPTFVYDENGQGDVHQGKFVVLLGNNGRLDLDEPASLIVSKRVTAADGLTAPDTAFTFTLTAAEKAGATVVATVTTPAADGQSAATTEQQSVSFDGNGVATFRLKGGQSIEIPRMTGVTYSVQESPASGFSLESSSGNTSGEVGDQDVTVSFTNRYSASGTWSPSDLTKTLNGRDWLDGESFTFELTGEAADGSPADGFTLPGDREIQVAPESVGGSEGKPVHFTFSPVTFTKPGTYTFTVTEKADGMRHGVSNTSGASVSYTVKVVDDGQGNLTAAPALVGEEGVPDFVNTYDPTDATAELSATKTVNGSSEDVPAGAFTFRIERVSGNGPMPSNAPDGTVTNGADGTIDFGTLTFESEGTYTYRVSEVEGSSTGYGYDKTAYTVVYEVTDDPDEGCLVASRTIHKGDASDPTVSQIAFNNTYAPRPVTTSASFSGTKSVTVEHGSFALEPGQFTFEIKGASEGEPMPSNAPDGTVTNGADGSIDFGTFTFESAGTYTYEVRERASELSGVSSDGTTYTLSFEVKDENGTLKVASQSIKDGSGIDVASDALDFTNYYNDRQVSVSLSGTKVLETGDYEGATLDAGDYSFALYEVGADGGERLVQTTANGAANGSVAPFSFDAITYTAPGSHTYKVYELGTDGQPGTGGTGDDGVVYSAEVRTVTVDVTSSGEHGGVAVNVTGGDDIEFTNTYSPTPVVVGPSGSARICGTKVLDSGDTGRMLADGEFTFELVDASGDVVSTATNAADGSFVFPDLTLDAAGTYAYTVREVDGGAGGIGYDDATYGVTVSVSEDARAHALVAEVSYTLDGADEAAMTFTNTYSVRPLEVALGAYKRLEGAELADGQFTFELRGVDGAPLPTGSEGDVATAANSADGAVLFDPITYTAAGTYRYTISERNDGAEGVSYDDATHTVEVTVADNGEGELVVSDLTYDGGAQVPVFTNSYEEAAVPGADQESTDGNDQESANENDGGGKETAMPGTGDRTNVAAPVALAICGTAVLVVAVVLLRRRSK